MRRKFLCFVLLPLLLLVGAAACRPELKDPGKTPGNEHVGTGGDEQVASPAPGYVAYRHNGWTYVFKEDVAGSAGARNAQELLQANLDELDELLPEFALQVMRKNPIWLEKNLTDGAAWYHAHREYLVSMGYMVEKYHCVELCNYTHYVSWVRQNQPYMVLHELCHLYHDQALAGGFENKDVKAAYENAMKEKLYVNNAYRLDQNTVIEHYDDYYGAPMYATNDCMEYFSEICEAYWGENDYYPFNYEDLRRHDPMGFALMEKVWGPRKF